MKGAHVDVAMIVVGVGGAAYLLYRMLSDFQAKANALAEGGQEAVDQANAASNSVAAAANQAQTMLTNLQNNVPFNLLGSPSQ